MLSKPRRSLFDQADFESLKNHKFVIVPGSSYRIHVVYFYYMKLYLWWSLNCWISVSLSIKLLLCIIFCAPKRELNPCVGTMTVYISGCASLLCTFDSIERICIILHRQNSVFICVGPLWPVLCRWPRVLSYLWNFAHGSDWRPY
jgi:hypothetical protein